jgi:hypothetical protein
MASPRRLVHPGTCPACGHRFADTDQVLRTTSNQVLCERHRSMLVPAAIAAVGPYADLRRGKRP